MTLRKDPFGAKSFLLEETPFQNGCKNIFERVASRESVPVLFKQEKSINNAYYIPRVTDVKCTATHWDVSYDDMCIQQSPISLCILIKVSNGRTVTDQDTEACFCHVNVRLVQGQVKITLLANLIIVNVSTLPVRRLTYYTAYLITTSRRH